MRRLCLPLAFLALCALPPSVSAAPQQQLTVLHTNDLHGALLPFDLDARNPQLRNVGGLARRATAIAQLRAGLQHPCVVLDCGDVFTRGKWAGRYYGLPEIEALGLMGYELMCVGNNEFKGKSGPEAQQVLLRLMRCSRFPWLAANVTVGDSGVPVEGCHPFVVRRYGELRVGFLGLTAPRTNGLPQVAGWTIGDPLAAAQHWVPIARRECDVLIAVTHLGVALDGRLAASVPGIDAIVGGDSHTYLRTPLQVPNPEGRLVPIAQAGELGSMLGQLDLTFEHTDGWRLVRSAGRLHAIDARYAEDPAVRALLYDWLSRPALSGWLLGREGEDKAA